VVRRSPRHAGPVPTCLAAASSAAREPQGAGELDLSLLQCIRRPCGLAQHLAGDREICHAALRRKILSLLLGKIEIACLCVFAAREKDEVGKFVHPRPVMVLEGWASAARASAADRRRL
jgi:hypothetical protein